MKINWSPSARRDVVEITTYIRKSDPRAAAAIGKRITQATRRLTGHPASGRPGRWPNTRELIITGTPYIVPYTVSGQDLEIIAVIHTARKWPEDPDP